MGNNNSRTILDDYQKEMVMGRVVLIIRKNRKFSRHHGTIGNYNLRDPISRMSKISLKKYIDAYCKYANKTRNQILFDIKNLNIRQKAFVFGYNGSLITDKHMVKVEKSTLTNRDKRHYYFDHLRSELDPIEMLNAFLV